MLCPEVTKFPPPRTMTSLKQNINLQKVLKDVYSNDFYKSLVITCPDEIKTPVSIENILAEDTDYYRISDCSLTEFVEPGFVENFIRRGYLRGLSADRNCMVENCVAITTDGVLTLHVLDFVFQTLGLDGKKRPNNFFEVKIDLKHPKVHKKVKLALSKLETFDLFLIWEPRDANVCPSSIARYFHDKHIKVYSQSLAFKHISPVITEVPSIKDVDAEDMVEWVGMLAIGGNLNQPESYISSYQQPESEFSLQTTRISVLIVKGFISSSLTSRICQCLYQYSNSRELENYWASVSVQSNENSLWQWTPSSPKMFQSHDNSFNAFFSKGNIVSYSVGLMKYT